MTIKTQTQKPVIIKDQNVREITREYAGILSDVQFFYNFLSKTLVPKNVSPTEKDEILSEILSEILNQKEIALDLKLLIESLLVVDPLDLHRIAILIDVKIGLLDDYFQSEKIKYDQNYPHRLYNINYFAVQARINKIKKGIENFSKLQETEKIEMKRCIIQKLATSPWLMDYINWAIENFSKPKQVKISANDFYPRLTRLRQLKRKDTLSDLEIKISDNNHPLIYSQNILSLAGLVAVLYEEGCFQDYLTEKPSQNKPILKKRPVEKYKENPLAN